MATIAELFDQAVCQHQRGNLRGAEALYRQILALDAKNVAAHNNLGNALLMQGQFSEGAQCFRDVLGIDSNYAPAHFNLGNVLFGRGELAEAGACFQQAIRADPRYVDAHNNLGNLCVQQGQLAEAAAHYRQALHIKPHCVDALTNLGNVLVLQGESTAATECYQHALRLNADCAPAHYNLGTMAHAQGCLEQAIADYRQALRVRPHYADAHNNLGNALREQGHFADAADCYRRALQSAPNKADLHVNLGNALKDDGQFVEAEASYRRALMLCPAHADAQNNLALALLGQGNVGAACTDFEDALRVEPTHQVARWNRACLRLLNGQLAEAWPDFELRWSQPGRVARRWRQPRWNGSCLQGRTILLHAEQGLGDTLQFLRYVPLVQARGARILMECQPPLASLVARMPGVDQILLASGPNAHGEELPAHDVQAPLMSLAGIFDTNLSTIPAQVPYVTGDPARRQPWRAELTDSDGLKIGIVWQGNPTQKDDRYRSVPLNFFAPLAKVAGTRLFSLQVGAGREQLAKCCFPIVDLGGRFDAGCLDDLAAVLPQLDLVVTVCTSVAHLAGALGVRGWVALKSVPYWCWLLGRSDSPWYPTLRLFRQAKPGAWPEVFENMAAALPCLEKTRGVF